MGCRDSISNLPDDIIGKILSLLPTKLVVSMSVLSKRWRNTFPLVDNFDYPPTTADGHSFFLFMNKYFYFLRDYTPPVKKFSLNCQHGKYSSSWIATALIRGCLELHLQCYHRYHLDFSVLSQNTSLVKLTLSDGIDLFPYLGLFNLDRVSFPALRSLSLGSVPMCGEVFKLLVWQCPVLEELFIRDGHDQSVWQGLVSSESIKRLTISVNNVPNDYVWFRTPSLVYLDYSSCVPCYYDEVGLGSLVEARLDIRFWESPNEDDGYGDFDGDVTDLVAGISHIKTLHLSRNSLEVFHWGCKSMPVFNNLLRLSIESDEERGWQVVPLLLKRSPNLQTLLIKGLVHKVTNSCGDACPCNPNIWKKRKMMKEEDTTSCLWTCQVKLLEISGYRGTCEELKQMRHFLEKLKYLETVKIGIERGNNDYLRVTNDLKTLPRVSPKCLMHFL